jgi:hypothetical protein
MAIFYLKLNKTVPFHTLLGAAQGFSIKTTTPNNLAPGLVFKNNLEINVTFFG